MVEQFVRIEAYVPQSVKDWIELESGRMNTPQKTIISNAMVEYKAKHDRSVIGQEAGFLQISANNNAYLIKNIQIGGQNSHFYPSLVEEQAILVAKTLKNLTFLKPKSLYLAYTDYRRGIIRDYLVNISIFKLSNNYMYLKCAKIVGKSLKGFDLEFYNELLNVPDFPGTPYNTKANVIDIAYVGGSLDSDNPESQIMEIANNCMMTGMNEREQKILDAIYIIQSTYPADKVEQYEAYFRNCIDRLELEATESHTSL